MTRLRKTVLFAACVLFAVWVVSNFAAITADQNGTVRFVLGFFFSVLVVCRRKDEKSEDLPAWVLPCVGGIGAVLAVGGIIVPVRQFEWLGLILVLFACLRWSLPPRFARDLLLAMFLLYWIHPLPGQVFAGFQLLMQSWAVAGAEWLLHCLNVRVWADGLVLRTGFRVFLVPAACSGMRAAVTVLLSSIGVGILLRLGWRTIVVTLVGLVQVLVLNIIRITSVVFMAPRMPAEWSRDFLHDSAGMFLLVSILLVQLEASWWRAFIVRRRRAREAVKSGEYDVPDRATRLPRVLHIALKWIRIALVLLVVVAVAAAVVFKSRAVHRETMRREVIDGLIETNSEVAEKALSRVLKSEPGNRDLRAKKIRVMLTRGKVDEALAEFAFMPERLTIQETVVKSWALMAVERSEEAVALIEGLPESTRKWPGVAIIRAEYAALRGEPRVASRNIVMAADSSVETVRIRALFPYLAAHGQWRAIAEADSGDPYVYPHLALIAARAHLKVGDLVRAARVLRMALKKWPDDRRFLGSLFHLALRQPDGEWEDVFANSLRKNLGEMDADSLSTYMDYCFRLTRPDLAWLAYARLQSIDSRDPALLFAPVQFGNVWFRLRRHSVGIVAEDSRSSIDLRLFFLQTRNTWPFKDLWDLVPLGDELSGLNLVPVRDRYVAECINELGVRKKEGRLSRRSELTEPAVVAVRGQFDNAHEMLDRLEVKYPDLKSQVLLQQAEFYGRQNLWQESYEELVRYRAEVDLTALQSELMMVNALMNMDFGVYALGVAERARRVFPDSPQADVALAAIWDVFGFKEQALFVLSGHEGDEFRPVVAQLLSDTGRIAEARKMRSVMGGEFALRTLGAKQRIVPMPAELCMARMWPTPLSAEEMGFESQRAQARVAEAASPLVRNIERLAAGWYGAQGSAAASDPAQWAGAGRDSMEQASALHRLAVLLARQKEYDRALEAIGSAVELMPFSAILRRIQIVLADGERETVEAARVVCPDDPAIWLASIVARMRDDGPGPWAMEDMKKATASGRFSIGTLVRAGDFMLRNGVPAAADVVARHAIPRCRGLLSAYALGMRCGLETGDAEWALSCALGAIEHAMDPGDFYKAIAYIKLSAKSQDADLVSALEYLRERFPGEAEWARQLGSVYFERGDLQRARIVLAPVIGKATEATQVRSLLLAAESARVEGQLDEAIRILRAANENFPDTLGILNNLVYSLASAPATLPEARELLPKLLEVGEGVFGVMDTAAMVSLRSGQLDPAREYMAKALEFLDIEDYAAPEVYLNEAEILYRSGEYDEARRKLNEIRSVPRVSPFIDVRARVLLEEIKKRTDTR